MGFSLFSNSKELYGIKNYIADTINDLKNIPLSKPGSMVYVIDESKYYIYNNQNKWVEKNNNSNFEISLQTLDPIIPTKQQQIIIPEQGYLGLTNITIEPIPDEYIIPNGEITFSENATNVNIAPYETANIMVPIPTMPEEYAVGGSAADDTAVGYYIKRETKALNYRWIHANSNLLWVDIPDSVETIGNNIFMQFGNMRLVGDKLPSSLKTLGNSAFYYCFSLVLYELPNTLESLGTNCFTTCTNIQLSKLPPKVTSYPTYCFFLLSRDDN